jgi:hypothetical protein
MIFGNCCAGPCATAALPSCLFHWWRHGLPPQGVLVTTLTGNAVQHSSATGLLFFNRRKLHANLYAHVSIDFYEVWPSVHLQRFQ